MRKSSSVFSLVAVAPLYFLSGTLLHAQKVILPTDKMTEEERANYEQRKQLMVNERTRKKPLFIQSAHIATQALGAEIMKGNADYAIANMYPRLKKIQAKRAGGEENMIKKLRLAQKRMKEDKTVIIDFKADMPKEILHVRMERKEGLAKFYFPVDFTFQKLLIVPTKTVIQFAKVDTETGNPLKVLEESCQLAIYDEKTKKWSFINGSTISANELRGLFPLIPKDVATGFPKQKLTRIKK